MAWPAAQLPDGQAVRTASGAVTLVQAEQSLPEGHPKPGRSAAQGVLPGTPAPLLQGLFLCSSCSFLYRGYSPLSDTRLPLIPHLPSRVTTNLMKRRAIKSGRGWSGHTGCESEVTPEHKKKMNASSGTGEAVLRGEVCAQDRHDPEHHQLCPPNSPTTRIFFPSISYISNQAGETFPWLGFLPVHHRPESGPWDPT